MPDVTRPRPGHADLAGALKYGHDDVRDVLERASARETAARVAVGSLARQLLGAFEIRLASHVSAIGDVVVPADRIVSFDEANTLPDDSPLRCVDAGLQERMIAYIDAARDAGDTWAAHSRSSPPAFRPASARTSSGTASSTAGSARR